MPNRVVVITGGSGGIGAATAERLSRRDDVALVVVRLTPQAVVAKRRPGAARRVGPDRADESARVRASALADHD